MCRRVETRLNSQTKKPDNAALKRGSTRSPLAGYGKAEKAAFGLWV